jgi:hypothetical protein
MAVFRQKHYEMFAAAVKRAKDKAGPEAVKAMLDPRNPAQPGNVSDAARLGVAALQKEIMDIFQEDNPKFKPLIFIEACGTGKDDGPT